MKPNIRTATSFDIDTLTELFWNNINVHTEYISHGEVQMGVGTSDGKPAADGKKMWKKYITSKIADKNSEVFIFDENDKIIGFTVIAIEEDGAEPFGVICDLYVLPKSRRKGFGEVLFNSGIEWLKNKGITDYYLESGKDNHGAHKFFEKRDFRVMSHIYYKKGI
jgi:ribosomal protein S18 acetylase RimI-like enzyme